LLNLAGVLDHFQGSPDPFKISAKEFLDFRRYAVLKQIGPLGQKLRGHIGPQALGGEPAIGGAAEIHFGIENLCAALTALS
jgi:hypothetical protein